MRTRNSDLQWNGGYPHQGLLCPRSCHFLLLPRPHPCPAWCKDPHLCARAHSVPFTKPFHLLPQPREQMTPCPSSSSAPRANDTSSTFFLSPESKSAASKSRLTLHITQTDFHPVHPPPRGWPGCDVSVDTAGISNSVILSWNPQQQAYIHSGPLKPSKSQQ